MHDATFERIRSALFHLSPEDRRFWVRQAMAIKSELGDDGFDLWDEWSALSSTYKASSAREVWRSVKTGGKVTVATLFWDAKQAGWKDDQSHKKPSAEELARRKAENEKRAAAAAAEEAARHDEAAKTARAIWDAATPCDTHAYLERKGVKSHGLRIGLFPVERVDEETGEVFTAQVSALLVPILDRSRNIWSMQAISSKPGGPKLMLAGGKKSGNFFVIGGKPKMDGDRPIFVLAEGYATGASAHEASGHTTVVCFDAGNMKKVALQMRERAPTAVLLIAADNDEATVLGSVEKAKAKGHELVGWETQHGEKVARMRDGSREYVISNPGVAAAYECAAAVGGLVAVPPPGDMNDLHASLGLEAVRDLLASALVRPPAEPAADPQAAAPAAPPADAEDMLKDDGGDALSEVVPLEHFTILGYYETDYWVFVRSKMQVIKRTRSDLSNDLGLIEIAPLDWWESYFLDTSSKSGGIDRRRAFEWFAGVAHSRGVYDSSRVRGRGAWRDSGRVVFHHGGYLTVDGARREIIEMTDSRWVYPMARSMPDPAPVPASNEDGEYLLSVARLARWSRPGSAALLAGWIFLAPVCGALRWRPHVWLTGAAGSGKTTLYEQFCAALLRGVGEQYNGTSTEPGIRQNLAGDAIPVLIDEFEPNDDTDRKRMKAVLTMARQASTETSAQTVKGTISGDGVHYNVRSMFAFVSINTMLDKDSDQSRITPLALRPPVKNGSEPDNWLVLEEHLHKIATSPDWSARLLARSLELLPKTLLNVEVFAKAAAKRFGQQRLGDQYGTLLAGAWGLTRDTVATEQEALALIDSYDWSEHKEAGDGMDDPQKALASVLEAKLRVGTVDVTVFELLAEAAGRPASTAVIGGDICSDVLRRNGIRIDGKEVLFGTSSKGLQALVKDTPYATDLRGQLRRLPGAHVRNNQTFKFSGVTSKVVALPLSLVLDEDEDEPPI